ncbi:hypothetical protein ACJJIX_01150 [Microbulbifer sp. VAAC004]|uniref:hypothetical protein n=1 Tax=unclassified Microbulbifer TaxID=2619833 RepID=UPI004038FF54
MPLMLTDLVDSILDFLSAPFVEAFLTTIFIGTGAALKKKIDTSAFRKLWADFFGESDSEIHVVLPLIKQKTLFSDFANRQSQIPDNVLFLPYDEAVGMQLLKEAIEKAFPRKKVICHDSRNFTGDQKSFLITTLAKSSLAVYKYSYLVDLQGDAPWLATRYSFRRGLV